VVAGATADGCDSNTGIRGMSDEKCMTICVVQKNCEFNRGDTSETGVSATPCAVRQCDGGRNPLATGGGFASCGHGTWTKLFALAKVWAMVVPG
jgi:hypothetical protein